MSPTKSTEHIEHYAFCTKKKPIMAYESLLVLTFILSSYKPYSSKL